MGTCMLTLLASVVEFVIGSWREREREREGRLMDAEVEMEP